jgi:hypothetical protein
MYDNFGEGVRGTREDKEYCPGLKAISSDYDLQLKQCQQYFQIRRV